MEKAQASPRLILERLENAPIQSPADSWNDAKVVKFPDTRGPFSCQITENPRQMPRYVPAGGVRGFTLTGALPRLKLFIAQITKLNFFMLIKFFVKLTIGYFSPSQDFNIEKLCLNYFYKSLLSLFELAF